METSPCHHKCEIILTDGRKKSVTLFSPSIGSLIEKIPMDKIDYKGQINHFPPDGPIFWDNGSQQHIRIEAEEMLNKLFDETSAVEQAPQSAKILEDATQSNTGSLFNRRNMFIIAGVAATVGISLLGLNYASQRNRPMTGIHFTMPDNYTYDFSKLHVLCDYDPFTHKTTCDYKTPLLMSGVIEPQPEDEAQQPEDDVSKNVIDKSMTRELRNRAANATIESLTLY